MPCRQQEPSAPSPACGSRVGYRGSARRPHPLSQEEGRGRGRGRKESKYNVNISLSPPQKSIYEKAKSPRPPPKNCCICGGVKSPPPSPPKNCCIYGNVVRIYGEVKSLTPNPSHTCLAVDVQCFLDGRAQLGVCHTQLHLCLFLALRHVVHQENLQVIVHQT